MSEYDTNEITIGDVKKSFLILLSLGGLLSFTVVISDMQHETNNMSYSNGYVPVNSIFGPSILPRVLPSRHQRLYIL